MRKEKYITLIDDGEERLFKIKQMSAIKQERWTNRLIVLLAGRVPGMKLPYKFDLLTLQNKVKTIMDNNDESSDDFTKLAKAVLQLLGSLKYEDMEPLYDELLSCCEYIPNPDNKNYGIVMTPKYAEGIISDFRTLYKLRFEAVKLCFGFFGDGESSPTIPGKKAIRITKHIRT